VNVSNGEWRVLGMSVDTQDDIVAVKHANTVTTLSCYH